MSGKGRRYDTEPKLNYKKVFAVIIAILVVIMIVLIIKNLLSDGSDTGRISSESYFAVYADNKWGVINSSGQEVITPSYEEMIIIPNEKKDVFLCTYDVNADTGEYKTKVLNSKNEEIFTEYDKVEALENIDSNNNVWYEESLLVVEKDGKYGLINFSGKEVLSCEYDSITTLTGVENSILVSKDGLYGLVNSEGTMTINVQYQQILKYDDDYKNGYIVVNSENKYGIVDYLGKEILSPNYEEIAQIYGKDLFIVTEDGSQKVVNTSGEVVLESGFDEITQVLNYSTSGVVFKTGDKFGVMNSEGEIVIEPTYDNLIEVKDSTFIAEQNGKYGIIGIDGTQRIDFIYTGIRYNEQADIFIAEDENYETSVIDSEFNVRLNGILSEINTDKGYMRLKVGDEYKYYNFRFEEKESKEVLTSNTLFLSIQDGKYGFVNQNGEVVVDYQYDDATEQNEYGYAAVKKDGLWGCIDTNGNVVVEPIYNLDNNYIIDFIGKWHLGQDINMNYYCEI